MKNISATDGLSNKSSKSSSSREDLPSKAKGIAWCSVFALEAVLIVAGNLLTIALFIKTKKLRKKSLYLIINMAFADLMLGAGNLPMHIVVLGNEYQLWSPTILNASWEDLFYAVIIFSQAAALTSAALVSSERFYAIYWPLKHLTLSVKAYCIIICVGWILSILICTIFVLLSLLLSGIYVIYFLASFFTTLLLIVCACNVGIWRKFHQGGIASQQQNRTVQNKRLTKTLLFVSFVALLSWLPLIIVQCLRIKTEVSPFLSQLVFFICYSNSFLNTVVYAWRIPEYKEVLCLSCFGTDGSPVTQHIENMSNDPIVRNMTCEKGVMDTQL